MHTKQSDSKAATVLSKRTDQYWLPESEHMFNVFIKWRNRVQVYKSIDTNNPLTLQWVENRFVIVFIEKLECEDIEDTKDGVYTIYPGGGDTAVDVYCIMRQSKKWTVWFCQLANYIVLIEIRMTYDLNTTSLKSKFVRDILVVWKRKPKKILT